MSDPGVLIYHVGSESKSKLQVFKNNSLFPPRGGGPNRRTIWCRMPHMPLPIANGDVDLDSALES
jgi:hypothetical protein